jgi:hypothetical protein
MPRSIFLFNGGNYKAGIDNGRDRVPLTPVEADNIFLDKELGNRAETGTSSGAELRMAEYAKEFSDLAVDDEIFMGLLPDAAFYRGIWFHAYNAVKGFTVEVSLVPVKDVYDAYVANDGDATGVAELAGSEVITFDFSDGVCHSSCDAVQLATMHNNEYNDHRNNAGQVGLPFDPVFAGLGNALYIRVKVVDLGQLGTSEGACCGKCNKDAYPTFKAGAILDTTCAEKQRNYRACCGVDAGCGECGDC